MKNIFYLDENLQPAKYKSDAVAIGYFFKDRCENSIYKLGNERFKKIVEITFFNPIGHFATWYQSNKMQKAWGEEHYPQYHSFLPSDDICNLIRNFTDKKFDNCWTRSYEDDGWPQYRKYPVILKDGVMFLGNDEREIQNVYVSLVLTKEEFLKINPNIDLID